MEYSRLSIMEPLRVSDTLLHCLLYIELLHPFTLNVNIREAAEIRNLSKTHGGSSLYWIALRL